MVDVSLIILSKTNSTELFQMNQECINSFVLSAQKAHCTFEIILVESNVEADFTYEFDAIQIIKPNEPFNFHKFGNIGLNAAKGEFYVFSNNDVIFDINFLSELNNITTQNKDIKSFSPFDRTSNTLPESLINENEFVLGYEIQKHLTGWCIIMHQSVYNTIKCLDERFNFYYADNDYAMQLQKYNIKHALLTKVKAVHLAGKSTKKEVKYFELPKATPKYIIRENWTWVLNNPKMIDGLIIFHRKWGSRTEIKLKLLIARYLSKIGLGKFTKYVL